VILARDKFKLNVLANALDEFPSFFQSGLAVSDKSLSSHQGYIEPHACLVEVDGNGRVAVWSSTRGCSD
jgi:hypothetical protein